MYFTQCGIEIRRSIELYSQKIYNTKAFLYPIHTVHTCMRDNGEKFDNKFKINVNIKKSVRNV